MVTSMCGVDLRPSSLEHTRCDFELYSFAGRINVPLVNVTSVSHKAVASLILRPSYVTTPSLNGREVFDFRRVFMSDVENPADSITGHGHFLYG